jgi:hypothetical protein
VSPVQPAVPRRVAARAIAFYAGGSLYWREPSTG